MVGGQWVSAKSQLPPPLQRDVHRYLESLQQKGLIRIGKDGQPMLTEEGEKHIYLDLNGHEAQRLILGSIAQEIEEGWAQLGHPFVISIRIRERLPRFVRRQLQEHLASLVKRGLLEQRGEQYVVTPDGEEALYGWFDE